MASSVGFDSAEYRRQFIYEGKSHVCRGLIGVGIKTEDSTAFKKAYEKAIEKIFVEFNAKRERTAYCAAELAAVFGPKTIDKESEALELFLKELLPSVSAVHLYYTYLFRFETVTIFGDDPGGHEKIPVMSRVPETTDFYDLIAPSYTMLCAWNYSRDRPREALLLDSFQGKVSPAWNEFYQTARPEVYFMGDRCNPLISSADLMTRLVKLRMLQRRARFIESEMISLIPEARNKFSKHFLGSYYLKKMVPHKRTRLDCTPFIRHPVTFIVREQPEEEEEKGLIEATPAFNELMNWAFENNGCIKYFHTDSDSRLIGERDFLFTFGERGEKIAKILKRLGKTFTHKEAGKKMQ